MTEPTSRCRGVQPLPARREPWMDRLLADPDACADLLREHGSPVNLIEPTAMRRNAAELIAAADEAEVALRIFLARKANKTLGLVDEARRLGLGVDVASHHELLQVLQRDWSGDDIIVTAAVKTDALLQLCLDHDVPVALDHLDEADRYVELAGRASRRPRVALRLAAEPDAGLQPTRFGERAGTWLDWLAGHGDEVEVLGVHFHLNGYAAADRVVALAGACDLVDALRDVGQDPRFVDIGGGIPMSYHDGPQAWQAWQESPVTWRDLPPGTIYPAHQAPVRGDWLREVLGAAGEALRSRGLQLRCEPGRSLLDGCGMTLARVAFRKHTSDGLPLVGLEMNRTQCRSAADDFPVDPVLLHPSSAGTPGQPIRAGWLVGAYCIEAELILRRPFDFDQGVAVGDVVAIPNTAGYMMHILESASHQIPLARNLAWHDGGFQPDDIDTWTA